MATAFDRSRRTFARCGVPARPLLGGLDSDHIEAVYPPDDIELIGELSKLVFRLRSIDPKFLEAKLPADARAEPPRLGDAIKTEANPAFQRRQ